MFERNKIKNVRNWKEWKYALLNITYNQITFLAILMPSILLNLISLLSTRHAFFQPFHLIFHSITANTTQTILSYYPFIPAIIELLNKTTQIYSNTQLIYRQLIKSNNNQDLLRFICRLSILMPY